MDVWWNNHFLCNHLESSNLKIFLKKSGCLEFQVGMSWDFLDLRPWKLGKQPFPAHLHQPLPRLPFILLWQTAIFVIPLWISFSPPVMSVTPLTASLTAQTDIQVALRILTWPTCAIGSKLPWFQYGRGWENQPNNRVLYTHYKDSLLKLGWPSGM